MPAEYMHCVDEEMKNGKSKGAAQKVCAISYYKRHGKTPQQNEHADAALAKMYDEVVAARKKRRDKEYREETK